MDIRFDEKLKLSFASAQKKRLWQDTPASVNRVEYWATGVQAYFDASPITKAATREQLKQYDPGLFALVSETMGYEERQDWRFPMQAR